MSEKIDIEQVDGIGALESLTTANKSNLVNAINEVNSKYTDFGGVNLVGDSHFYNGVVNGWSNVYGTQVVEDHIYKKTFTILNGATRIEREFTNLKAGIYTLTIFVKTPVAISWYSFVNGIPITGLAPSSPNEFARRSVTFSVPTDGNVTVRGYVPSIPVGSVIEIDWFKLETGYIGSDWTPTQEEQKSDWNVTNPLKASYIKNKPTIPNAPNNGLLTISTSSDLTGGGTFSSDQATASNVDIGLSAGTLSNIQLGVTAHGWGRGLKIDGNGLPFYNLVNNAFEVRNSSAWVSISNRPNNRNSAVVNFTSFYFNSSTYGFSLGARENRIYFVTEENSVFGNWLEFWHTGNFNPAQYVLQTSLNTQLGNYVPINGVTTINNTKTFTSSPVVPNATLDGHAVNLGQLNGAVSSVKTRIGINGSDYTDAGDINLIANSGVILNKVGNNIYIESTGTPHSSKMTNEVNFPDFTTIELNTDKHYIYCDNSYNFSEITIDVGQAKDGYELIIFCGEDPSVGQNPEIIMNADVIRPNGQEYDTILLSRGKWYRFIYFKDLDKLMLSGYGEV